MTLNKEKTLVQRWLLNLSIYYPAPKASSQLVKFMTAVLLTIRNVFLKTPKNISGLVKSVWLNFCYCLNRSSVLSTEQDFKKAHFSKHVVVKQLNSSTQLIFQSNLKKGIISLQIKEMCYS